MFNAHVIHYMEVLNLSSKLITRMWRHLTPQTGNAKRLKYKVQNSTEQHVKLDSCSMRAFFASYLRASNQQFKEELTKPTKLLKMFKLQLDI